MNSKFLVGGLLGAIVSFLLGFLFYGTLFKDMLNAETLAGTQRAMADIRFPMLIVSNLGSGFLMAYVFSKWSGGLNFTRGLSAGAMIGLLMGITYDFAFYATSLMMSMKGYMIDIVITIVISGIVGGIVAWWMGRGTTAA